MPWTGTMNDARIRVTDMIERLRIVEVRYADADALEHLLNQVHPTMPVNTFDLCLEYLGHCMDFLNLQCSPDTSSHPVECQCVLCQITVSLFSLDSALENYVQTLKDDATTSEQIHKEHEELSAKLDPAPNIETDSTHLMLQLSRMANVPHGNIRRMVLVLGIDEAPQLYVDTFLNKEPSQIDCAKLIKTKIAACHAGIQVVPRNPFDTKDILSMMAAEEADCMSTARPGSMDGLKRCDCGADQLEMGDVSRLTAQHHPSCPCYPPQVETFDPNV